MTLFLPQLEDFERVAAGRKQCVPWYWLDKAKVPLVRFDDKLLTSCGWNDDPERWFSAKAAYEWAQRESIPVQLYKDGKLTRRFNVQPAGVGIITRYDLNPPEKILVAFDYDDHDKKGILIQDGKIVHPVVEYLVKELNSYTEITPSGFGLRTLVVTDALPENILPGVNSDITYENLPLEIFVSQKFITFTGKRLEGTPADVNYCFLDHIAKKLVRTRNIVSGPAPTQIPKSQRHDFFRRKLTALIKDGWIRDRNLLMALTRYLRDTYCEAPEEKTEEELSRFVEWALTKLSLNPLWQGNDNYLASKIIKEDERCANIWAGKARSEDDIDYFQTKLLELCGNDAEQAIRIYQGSPLYQMAVPERVLDSLESGE